ncbi:DUF3810 domain-containing protein [Pedobacter yonginense]|uniref:DUF3810 domain-containing protein n=1 Tax=Pedobacter yonginense TaxID=651869 RepID=A0A317ET89_9SPHI|nr:DUF3810 domain-containing protein [Pedobacter yonginense]PWS28368.1 DUF3810 domain-containing protein [Pedobacter yonginense]
MITRTPLSKSIILAGVSILIFLFGLSPSLVQKYYSSSVYPLVSASLRWVSSIFPFAIGDVIYVLLVSFVLYNIFRFFQKLKRKQLQKSDRITLPLQILNFFLILNIIFKLFWGLNYRRPSVSEELGIGNKKYNTKELAMLANYFVKKTNDLKAQVIRAGKTPIYTIQELESLSASAYQIKENQNLVFKYANPCVKPVLNSWLISKVGIEGYYAPLSGEANINMNLPDFVRPYVTCHEIAHQLGIAYEDEANLLGYLTASNSLNIYYRYSANYEMLRYILFEIRMKSPDDYKPLHDKLLPEVLADFKIEKEFWRKYNGDMFGYMDAAFDRFLKLNNQKKGTDSYQDIVIWLWNIHENEIISKS